MPTSSATSPHRIIVLDALRGLAALVVVLAHTFQLAYATEQPILHGMGRFGVVLFFLVSGFVMPSTFARNGSQRVFWTRRLCRLLPLYWCTVAVAAMLLMVGWLPDTPFYPARSAATYAVNLSMIPNLLGYPSVLSVFWSLHIEIVFYAIVAATGFLRLQHKPLVAGLTLLTLALLSPFVPGMTLYYPVFLALVWCGVVVQHSIAQHQPLIKAIPFVAATFGLVVLGEGMTGLGPFHIGTTAAALVVFVFALWRPGWFRWRWLLWLGSVSYSLYLTHLLVLAAVPPLGSPITSMVVWLACMLAVAAAAERWIERPSIALGQWLTRPRARSPHEGAPSLAAARSEVARRV